MTYEQWGDWMKDAFKETAPSDLCQMYADWTADREAERQQHDYEVMVLDEGRKAAEAELEAQLVAYQARLKEIDDLATERDKLAKRVRQMATFIVAHEPYYGYDTDQTCTECVPGGKMVQPSFRCGFHEAIAVLEQEEK